MLLNIIPFIYKYKCYTVLVYCYLATSMHEFAQVFLEGGEGLGGVKGTFKHIFFYYFFYFKCLIFILQQRKYEF